MEKFNTKYWNPTADEGRAVGWGCKAHCWEQPRRAHTTSLFVDGQMEHPGVIRGRVLSGFPLYPSPMGQGRSAQFPAGAQHHGGGEDPTNLDPHCITFFIP